MSVPDGVCVVQSSAFQVAALCASRTREVNVPDVAKGVIRIQSTPSVPLGLESLAAGRRLDVSVAAWRATWTPSMKYVAESAAQSIRNRWNPFMADVPRGVSTPPGARVRAYSWSPVLVLNSIQSPL